MIRVDFAKAMEDRQSARNAELESEFRRYVIELAGVKKTPDADGVLDKLSRLGKTPEELTTALNTLRERRALAAKIPTIEPLRAEVARLSAEIDAERESFKKLKAEHQDRIATLQDQRFPLESDLREAGRADQQLRQTCNPELRAELDEAGRAYSQIELDIVRVPEDEPQREQVIAELTEQLKLAQSRRDELRAAALVPESF